MKKNLLFCIVLLNLLFLFSCEKDYKKIVEKMFGELNEDGVKLYWYLLKEQLSCVDDYYVWNGKKCELKISGKAEEHLNALLKIHKEQHCFVDKKGKFNQQKWNDWMYYWDTEHSKEIEDSEKYVTACPFCKEKKTRQSLENDIFADIFAFEESLVDNPDYNTRMKLSVIGNLIEEREKELTKIYQVGTYKVYYYYDYTINDCLKRLSKKCQITKKVKDNKFIFHAGYFSEGEEVISLDCILTKHNSLYSSDYYVSEIQFDYHSQRKYSKCYDIYYDQQGAGECLGILMGAINIVDKL